MRLFKGLGVDDGGGGGGGPELLPVVFVHSAGGSTGHWRAQLAHLRGEGRRAVALDLRGHGDSEAKASRDTPVDRFADDLGTVADGLGLGRFVLAGHSFGGAVALAYAAAHPQRVAGLLLVDPASDGRQVPPEAAQGLLQALANDETYLPTMDGYWGPMLATSTEAVRAQVLGDLRRAQKDAVYATLASMLPFDPVAALQRYPGPRRTLVTHLNRGPDAYQNLVPDLPAEEVDGVGHWLQLDAPLRVNDALDRFLQTVR